MIIIDICSKYCGKSAFTNFLGAFAEEKKKRLIEHELCQSTVFALVIWRNFFKVCKMRDFPLDSSASILLFNIFLKLQNSVLEALMGISESFC